MECESAHRFFEAAERGIAWIAAQQRPDGSFCNPEDGVGSYYKVPYAMALTGHQREALHLLTWVAEHHFTADGDFRAPERKARNPVHEGWPAYSNAWIIQGAHRVGRWDISLRGTGWLLRHQAPSGAFYALDGERRYMEPVCTSWGGLAVLTTGHVEEARRAGDLLVSLVEAQPDPERFYFQMDTKGRIVTDVPTGSESSYYVDAAARRQIYYNPGIALIFLSHLYRATGEERYLNAGKKILLFTERCADDVHRFPPSGKLGLGSALMYGITGSPEGRRTALQVGEYLVETQEWQGFWRLPDVEPYSSREDRDSYDVRLDLSAEFTAFLAEIASRI